MKNRRKRTPNRLLTDTLREIKNTRSRFISIMILSALAVCFLAGLRVTEPDMKNSVDQYLDAQRLMDLRVVSTLGLTEEDVEVLSRQEGVELAQGAYTIDATVKVEDKDSTVKVLSFTDNLNIPNLQEGRLPEKAGECLVEPRFLQETGLSVGDTITLDTGTGDYKDALKQTEFTIVGSANSPLYIGVERGSSTLGTGKVSYFILLPMESFDMETYTDAYLLFEGASELMTYSDAYEQLVEERTDQLEPLSKERAQLRGDSIRDEAQEEIDKAKQELADAEAEVAQELADAEAELADARKELDDGWAEYRDGENTFNQEIADAEQEIADGEKELADALQELIDGENELKDARKELDDGWADYEEGRGEYLDGLQDYYEGEQKYKDGLKEYEDGVAELEDARKELDDGWDEYYDGVRQYNSGVAQLNAGRRELQQQEAAFQEGLTQFREQLKILDANLSFANNSDLLAAMAGGYKDDINDALDNARENLNKGIQLLDGIAQLEQQLGEYADIDTDDLAAEKVQLEGAINEIQGKIQELQGQLDDLDTSASNYEAQKAALEGQIAAQRERLAEAQGQLAGLEKVIPFKEQLDTLRAQREAAGLTNTTSQQLQTQLNQLYTTDASGQPVPVSTSVFLSGNQAIQDGWQEIYDGEAELASARRQLNSAKKQLEEGEEEYEDGVAQLEDAKKELDDAKKELEDGWAELEDGRLELEDAKKKLDDGEADYAQGLKDWQDGKKEYEDGLIELQDGKKTLEQERADGLAELADAKKELDDGEAEYADGYQEYLDGKAEAEAEIADAKKKVEQAQRDLDDLDDCEWYLLDRDTNMGFVSYSMDADRMGNLASVFPLIFFLVAALVCLTTMTRMVEEQRVAIGGMKALGYSKGAIAIKYVGYGFLASAVGSLVGLAVGLTLLPWIICTSWKIIYTFGPIHYGIEPVTSVTACLAAVGTVTLSALGACFNTLAAVPAQLMRPKAPPMGKRILLERITPLWRRLSFNYKITLRNLFRYQKRFWMTVIGIGGCAALIVTAFGLRDSIFAVMEKQYEEIYRYSAQLGLVEHITPGEWAEVEKALEGSELVGDWTKEHTETVTAETDAYTADATLEVVENSEVLERFVNLRHRTDNDTVTLPDDGVILTEKLSLLLDVEVGDTITLDGDSRVEVRVADITEHYIQHSIYMSQAYYEQVFGQTPEENAVLVSYDTQADGAQELEQKLVSLDGVSSLTRIEDTRKTFGTSLESVDYAVALIIVCAAALAFVVLYNLTNINITERMRELATLKVLGFYDGELSAYIYRENVILTVFGVAMGMVMGKFLHQWLILTVEIDLLMFGRTVAPTSYLWAVLLTTVFSLVVNLAAHRKLKKLDMVESLKTVE
ncbi:FtsX-like permease family protein [Flintibacter sp. KGMB00164]|uniref:FtsX-like permease family protein n=1 Tax=Flintibacter sp. KGMB00164 TaxID=2610895 RepID=UPI0012462D15|nr:FtsX-like permease family protein [Flintibacter sp. KGMB00164]